MKNKKAFTLIELLAVIIVLAIILTITIPVISNIVTNSRKASFKSDARLVLDQARIQKNQNEDFDPTTISYDNLGTYNLSNQNYESLTISMVNNKPYIYVVGKNKWAGFKACGTYNDMGVYEVTETGTCQGDEPPKYPDINDTTPGVICGSTAADYSTVTDCYIESVEDLAAFSSLSNSGKDFAGKTVHLVNGLDINSTKSYVNSTTTALGDINGDGTTSGLLTEMTTGKGFNPIGNSVVASQFKGTFEGNAKTIGNLYINRPAQSYVGLFGYTGATGIVKGLNIETVNITGLGYVGGIVGFNAGITSSVYVQGSINGNGANVGGITGQNSKSVLSALTNVNITNTGANTGGIVGYAVYGSTAISGLDEGGSVNGTSYVGTGIGRKQYGDTPGTTYASSTITSIRTSDGINGTVYSVTTKDEINIYDVILDTWIGGDNDSDGYYFDYDKDGNIVVISVSSSPMTFALSGTGVVTDPYLINNYNEWKQATLKTNGGYYFKLTNDIDFNNQNFYAFGSNANYFSGNFDGDMNKLSNISTQVMTNGGIFGYNTGTISGLEIETLNLTGMTYFGGVTGCNTGTIKGINITNSVFNGVGFVGGIAGRNAGTINDSAVQGTINGTGTYIGGVVGHSAGITQGVLSNTNVSGSTINVGGIIGRVEVGSSTTGIAIGGSVTGTTYVGRTLGYNPFDSYYSLTYSSNSITATRTSAGNDGVAYSSLLNGDINAYDVILDTLINGDNNSNGYYFDYDDNGNVIIKSVTKDPLNFTLSGTGVITDPYLINNYNEWKQAVLKTTGSYYFKLQNDIDFSGKKYYAFGSNSNYFNGVFDGDMNKLSNIDTKVMINSGLFGYNTGTIKGLNIDSLNLLGSNYVGTATGYNKGTISGFNITDLNIEGASFVGGVAGYNGVTGTISDVAVQGDIKGGAGSYIGGVVGQSSRPTISVLANVNVTSTGPRVGGIIGSAEVGSTTKGFVENGSVTGSTLVGKALGYNPYDSYTAVNYVSSSVVTTRTSAGHDGTSYSSLLNGDINNYDVVLDTWINGDNDSDGYYFDYNDNNKLVVKSVENNPLTFNLTGTGVVGDPYIINNYSDWKAATLKTVGGYYFKLQNDINFSGKKYYAFGSNGNYFNGVFDGDMYSISNITTKVATNGGLFGYNTGTVKGLNIASLNLLGSNNAGTITGYNTGTIQGLNITNLILEGTTYVGGVAGYSRGTISEIAVQGNISGSTAYVGGVAGNTSSGNKNILADVNVSGLTCVGGIIGRTEVGGAITGVYENGTITGTTTTGKAMGWNPYDSYSAVNYVSGSVIVNRTSAGNDGIAFLSSYVNSLSKYDEYGLDTKYGGDNDSSGYYFDYNSDSTNILVKSITKNPIVTTPVTYPDVEEPAGTDTNGSSCSITGGCTAQGTTSMRCGYTYLYNSNPISGYQSGYTFSMTKGSSCATAVADNTDGGLLIYTGKKSTATGTCSVVLKITATGGTYNCASTKYSSFTFN